MCGAFFINLLMPPRPKEWRGKLWLKGSCLKVKLSPVKREVEKID